MRTLSLLAAGAVLALCAGPAAAQSAPAKEEQQKRVEAERKVAEERVRYAREVQEAHRKLQAEVEAKARDLQKLRDQLAEETQRRAAEERARHAREVLSEPQKLKVDLEAKARELEKLRDQLADELKRKSAAVASPGVRAEGFRMVFPSPEVKPTSVPQPPVAVSRPEGVRVVQPGPAPVADPNAAIRPLTRSSDPKVAALAAELLERIAKSSPGLPGATRVAVVTGTPSKPVEVVKTGEPLKVVVAAEREKVVKTPEAYTSLRLSADGKTAAVIGTDGSVTVYDTASGKEMMRFPVKK